MRIFLKNHTDLQKEFFNINYTFKFRTFSGYALSMEDWGDKLEELSNDIEDRNDVGTTVFTTSYSSPFVEADKRRNEVGQFKSFLKLRIEKKLYFFIPFPGIISVLFKP